MKIEPSEAYRKSEHRLKKSNVWCTDKTSARRNMMFLRQEKLRRDFFKKNRQKVMEAVETVTFKEVNRKDKCVTNESNVKNSKKKKKQRFFQSDKYLVNQLVIPDFLVDVPANLSTEWFAYCRPEGLRVLLAACLGKCYVFRKSGEFLTSFPSCLPREGCTILDAVLCHSDAMKDLNCSSTALETIHDKNLQQELRDNDENNKCIGIQDASALINDKTIFILVDCISWGDCSLADLSADCRRYILQSKFEELEHLLIKKSNVNKYPIHLVPVLDASPDNLDTLYNARNHVIQNVPTDSIIFVHKEALYIPGLSQLYLCWKDPHLSRYYVDTTDGVTVEYQQISNVWLQLKDGKILTEDGVRIAEVPVDSLEEQLNSLRNTVYIRQWKSGQLKDKILIRVQFAGLNLKNIPLNHLDTDTIACESRMEDTSTCCTDLLLHFKIIDTPSIKRHTGESLNRIIHQFLMRQHLKEAKNFNRESFFWLSFEDIKKCSALGSPNFTLMLLQGGQHLEDFWEASKEEEDYFESSQDDESISW